MEALKAYFVKRRYLDDVLRAIIAQMGGEILPANMSGMQRAFYELRGRYPKDVLLEDLAFADASVPFCERLERAVYRLEAEGSLCAMSSAERAAVMAATADKFSPEECVRLEVMARDLSEILRGRSSGGESMGR